jgi:nucleotide-binding universal stress UspA family protein
VYQKILLTHDGSEVAATAVPHAQMLAQATGASVVVVQVIDSVAHILAQATPATIEPIPAGPLTAELAEESIDSQRQAAHNNLEAVKAQLEGGGVGTVTTRIEEGQPGDAIVEAAQAEGADLIVMATHGRSGIGRAVLGSVADHVARHVKGAAILLVRPPTTSARR